MYDRARRHGTDADTATTAARAPGKRTLTGQLAPRVSAAAGAALGHDFTSVTVHEDGQADALGTRAFAHGEELHFAAGAYQPDSPAGLSLIGHELAHVAQQREGRVAPTGVIGGMAVNTDPALEAEADAGGARVAQGFDLDTFLDFGLPSPRGAEGAGAASTAVVQGEDLPSTDVAPSASPAPTSRVVTGGDKYRYEQRVDGTIVILAGKGGVPLVPPLVLEPGDATGRAIAAELDALHGPFPAPSPAGGTPPEAEETSGVVEGEPETSLIPPLDRIIAGIGGVVDGVLAAIGSLFGESAPAADDPTAPQPPSPVEGPASAPSEAAPTAPVVTRDPNAPPPTLGQVPGAPEVPGGEPLAPTTTAMTDSVGEGGKNQHDDLVLVQSRLRDLGYPVNATGAIDDATIRAIKLFQAARTAYAVQPGQKGSLVGWIDGRIDAGGPSAKALFSNAAQPFTSIAPSGVKPIGTSPQASLDAATGESRAIWDRLLAVWNQVSPYLVGDAYMSSGYRSEADQARIIEDFYVKTKVQGGYKEALIATHGEAGWSAYVGLDDDGSIEIKRQRVKALGQDVAAPGSSPHQSGRAIDIGGTQEAEQILALLRFAIEIDAALVTLVLYEKNTCIHLEFAA